MWVWSAACFSVGLRRDARRRTSEWLSDVTSPSGAWFSVQVDDSDVWKRLQNEWIALAHKWLASAQPAIPLSVSGAIAADARNSFALARAQQNFR